MPALGIPKVSPQRISVFLDRLLPCPTAAPAHHGIGIWADPLTRALAETRTYAGDRHPPACLAAGPARGSVQRAGSLSRPAQREISIPLAAFRTAQDPRPIGIRRARRRWPERTWRTFAPAEFRSRRTRRGKRYQERGSSCLPVFGAVLWALAGVTRRPCKFERALTIEVLSSTRFLEPATSGRGLTQRVTAAV